MDPKNAKAEENGTQEQPTSFATLDEAKKNRPEGKGAERKRIYHVVIRKEHVGERFVWAPNPQIAAGSVCQDLGVGIATVDTVDVNKVAAQIGTLSAEDRKRLFQMLKAS